MIFFILFFNFNNSFISNWFFYTILILSTSVIFFIFFKNNYLIFIKNYFFLLFLLFIISISISSLLSGNIKSIISSFGFIRFLFFIFLTSFLIQKSKKDIILLIFYGIFFTFIYLLLEFSSQIIFKQTLFGNEVYNYDRFIISSFYHEEIYSSYIVRILPFFLVFIFLKKIN